MSDPLTITPRRIVPWTGPFAWTPAEVPPSEWMIPLGAEHAAEIGAAGATPRLDALAAELRNRLDHGRGFALLRGLPAGSDPSLTLMEIARRIGKPVPAVPAGGTRHAEACDALLVRAPEAASRSLVAAASVHNLLLRTDRAALAALYERQAGTGVAVFSAEEGVYAGRWDDSVLAAEVVPALAAAAADASLALPLDMRAGDILALNPFLVWATQARGATVAAARTEPTRLAAAAFAPLR
ncbi:hypothetical protein ACE7GA_22860 [Roseomonas sp. CCTCC AB2023176]|uniref:hypothetical protein n=1 Tax=Roseomonas sp. CCTCC AB2023176 TaxID=3342640 RepID=UPI0035D8FE25